MAESESYSVNVRQLEPADAEAYVAVRCQAVQQEPSAFGASPDDDRASSVDFVRAALAKTDQAVFGAFDPELVGIVGVVRNGTRKGSHKASIWGMYVRGDRRGAGIGRRLMDEALQFARRLDGVTHVHLCVSERAHAAAAMYRSLGFRVWGEEPGALRVGDTLISEQHMVLILDREV